MIPDEMCHGTRPLPGRREPWMDALLADPDRCAELLATHGSPVNVLHTGAMARHAAELTAAAVDAGVRLRIFVARKANKALAVVDEAKRLGLGIDVGSLRELQQVLERGMAADDVVVTAAVKNDELLRLCLASGVTLVLDNLDEAARLLQLAEGRPVRVALRLAVDHPSIAPTRFGEAARTWLDWLAHEPAVEVTGVHFHLHGYAAEDRVTGLRQALTLVDALRERGHAATFIDMGGGIPMSYHDGPDAWQAWQADPLTWRDQPLGTVYPGFQRPIRGEWLAEVLATTADELRHRDLELRCEPGRAMLDGCGMTLARVAFRKHTSDGLPLVGLEMNRTQVRSAADDFPVDPVLVRPSSAGEPTGPLERAWFVGAYCIEAELITRRPMELPQGAAVGDVVAFCNTAGYMMHILESASHQIPLARNVVLVDDRAVLDDIERAAT